MNLASTTRQVEICVEQEIQEIDLSASTKMKFLVK
jgi:hypothetical protein